MADVTNESGIDKAIATAGDALALAKVLGVTRQYVYKARAKGWVSPARAAQLEALYGIPKAELMNPELVQAVVG